MTDAAIIACEQRTAIVGRLRIFRRGWLVMLMRGVSSVWISNRGAGRATVHRMLAKRHRHCGKPLQRKP
jgi:DNA-binding LacI/PurR family transcriptional regulator